MWLSNKLVGMFQISKDTVETLREELSSVRAERDALKLQAAVNQTHFDWLRTKINGLELERAGLLEKAYNIRLPVPEIVRAPTAAFDPREFSFEDLGDDFAKKLGMPVFSPPDNE